MIRIFADRITIKQIMHAIGDRVVDVRAWSGTPDASADTRNTRRAAERALIQVRDAQKPFPKVVTLCGSTKFKSTFERVNFEETMSGNLVISLGVFGHFDMPDFDWSSEAGQRSKTELDTLHLRKIDLADEILVINVDGYIGSSTRSEIAYARAKGKPVRYLEDPIAHHIRKELEE